MTEPKPWPRAQSMPFVTVGERTQPHHLQAIAEYDETRGETTPRHHTPSMYTAAHINQAIEWWNKRAELEAAIAPGPMSDERLTEIRKAAEQYRGSATVRRKPNSAITHRGELLAEVDRLRALAAPAGLFEAAADSVTPEQIAEWQRAWDEIVQQPHKIRILPSPAGADRLRTDLEEAATLLAAHLGNEECWISEAGTCIRHGSSVGEPCRMPQTRELLKRIHSFTPHPHSAAVGCIYPGCENPNHKPRTRDYPAGA